MSGASAFAKDLLFATLDPAMRSIKLPSGSKVIVSDTVGFISDLPTSLVAAFRATLEEVQSADIILHVRDIAHPDTEAQKADVEAILKDLGIDPETDPRVVEVLNKVDLLEPADQASLQARTGRSPAVVPVSAVTGEGLERLLAMLDQHRTANRQVVEVEVDLTDGATLSWLYARGEVLDRRDDEAQAHLRVAMEPAHLARFAGLERQALRA
jgi:GTPase